jgi:hypothetical protein
MERHYGSIEPGSWEYKQLDLEEKDFETGTSRYLTTDKAGSRKTRNEEK